jgi:hypothetical protein
VLKKVYKTIEQENGTVTIYGSNRWIPIQYGVPEWERGGARDDETEPDLEPKFRYRGQTYFLSEFMAIHNRIHNPNPPEWMKEFDGHHSDSFFSGILIKLSPESDAVKAFTYIV